MWQRASSCGRAPARWVVPHHWDVPSRPPPAPSLPLAALSAPSLTHSVTRCPPPACCSAPHRPAGCARRRLQEARGQRHSTSTCRRRRGGPSRTGTHPARSDEYLVLDKSTVARGGASSRHCGDFRGRWSRRGVAPACLARPSAAMADAGGTSSDDSIDVGVRSSVCRRPARRKRPRSASKADRRRSHHAVAGLASRRASAPVAHAPVSAAVWACMCIAAAQRWRVGARAAARSP